MDDLFNINSITNALKKFIQEFNNPRSFLLFKNFVICQAEVKNNYFKSMESLDQQMYESQYRALKSIQFLEEKFIFYHYVLYKTLHDNPELTIRFLENFKKIIHTNLKGTEVIGELNNQYRFFQAFVPDEIVIRILSSTGYNTYLDIYNFNSLKENSKEVEFFLNSTETSDWRDEEYLFQILRYFFYSTDPKIFMGYLEFVYKIKSPNKTIMNLSINFLLEALGNKQFIWKFINTHYYEKKDIYLFSEWNDKSLLKEYIRLLLKEVITRGKADKNPQGHIKIFFKKILELDKNVLDLCELDLSKLLDLSNEFFGKSTISPPGNTPEADEILKNITYPGSIKLDYIIYTIIKENYKLSDKQIKNINGLKEIEPISNLEGILVHEDYDNYDLDRIIIKRCLNTDMTKINTENKLKKIIFDKSDINHYKKQAKDTELYQNDASDRLIKRVEERIKILYPVVSKFI